MVRPLYFFDNSNWTYLVFRQVNWFRNILKTCAWDLKAKFMVLVELYFRYCEFSLEWYLLLHSLLSSYPGIAMFNKATYWVKISFKKINKSFKNFRGIYFFQTLKKFILFLFSYNNIKFLLNIYIVCGFWHALTCITSPLRHLEILKTFHLKPYLLFLFILNFLFIEQFFLFREILK